MSDCVCGHGFCFVHDDDYEGRDPSAPYDGSAVRPEHDAAARACSNRQWRAMKRTSRSERLAKAEHAEKRDR